ncbi:MAG: hypothetical protein AAFZ07_08985 [Actinomycetota bacterium]
MGRATLWQRSRFLLRPWRFDFEYARAWFELDFPLYGLEPDLGTSRSMGGKGRSGRVPPGPLRHLPPMWWTSLDQLGVVISDADWTVEISSSARGGPPRPVPGERSDQVIPVEGRPCEFVGSVAGGTWCGATVVDEATIAVTARGIDPGRLRIVRIDDPSAHLSGERDRFRRR